MPSRCRKLQELGVIGKRLHNLQYIYIHVYIYTLQIFIHLPPHRCTYTYICIHMYVYTIIYRHICMYIYICKYTCMHVCMLVCMYVCVHMYVYIYMHTHTYRLPFCLNTRRFVGLQVGLRKLHGSGLQCPLLRSEEWQDGSDFMPPS